MEYIFNERRAYQDEGNHIVGKILTWFFEQFLQSPLRTLMIIIMRDLQIGLKGTDHEHMVDYEPYRKVIINCPKDLGFHKLKTEKKCLLSLLRVFVITNSRRFTNIYVHQKKLI